MRAVRLRSHTELCAHFHGANVDVSVPFLWEYIYGFSETKETKDRVKRLHEECHSRSVQLASS